MPGKLKKYQSMRDFGATPEPSGHKSGRKAKKLIFVVQKHHASHLHYDFRLEMEGVLKSWAVPKGPSYDPAVKRLAMMTEDHPYDYASFEGVIPEGNYGAGNVIVWDNGTWELLEESGSDPVEAVRSGSIKFTLRGKKLFGEWALVQLKGRSTRNNEWLLVKHRDQYASRTVDVTEAAPLSILSGKDVEDVGDGEPWQSNRKASSRKPRTVADALQEKKKPARPSSKAKKEGSGRRPAALKKSSSTTARRSRSGSKSPSTRRSGSSRS